MRVAAKLWKIVISSHWSATRQLWACYKNWLWLALFL